MNSRDTILARIREALTLKAHAHHGDALPTSGELRQVLPPVSAVVEEQLALFAKNAADLKASFKPVKDGQELETELKALCAAEKWQRVATQQGPLAGARAGALGLPVVVVDGGYDKQALERCDAGISECDLLIAQTGTVVVTSRTSGGRALSCLPPHHVVIARRSQLVADLPTAFERLQQKFGSQFPSMISFVTGPSRTGDIERILVLGAHGPKRLTIFCLPD